MDGSPFYTPSPHRFSRRSLIHSVSPYTGRYADRTAGPHTKCRAASPTPSLSPHKPNRKPTIDLSSHSPDFSLSSAEKPKFRPHLTPTVIKFNHPNPTRPPWKRRNWHPCSAARRRLAKSHSRELSRESGTSHLKYKAPSCMTLSIDFLLPLVFSHTPQTNMTYLPSLTHTPDYNLTLFISHDYLHTYPLNLVFYWEFKAG